MRRRGILLFLSMIILIFIFIAYFVNAIDTYHDYRVNRGSRYMCVDDNEK